MIKSLIITEMHIKTTVRFHLTPVSMTIIKKSTNNKYWIGCGEKGTLQHCWWEGKLVRTPWRTMWRSFKNLKTELLYDPAIPFLGIYPEKTIIPKDSCTLMFTEALFTIARTWKKPQCPSTSNGYGRSGTIHTMEYYPAIKRAKECHLQQHGWT